MASADIGLIERSFFTSVDRPAVASARAGNVIGGGDWATDRIVPDCIRALSAGRTIEVRNPHAVRPWQHVLEPLSAYLTLPQEVQHMVTLVANKGDGALALLGNVKRILEISGEQP